jgi:hypothetical protein
MTSGTLAWLAGSSSMRDTGPKAKAGMSSFVVVIAAIAALLAGIYIVFWTPGETQPEATPHAINRSE